MLGYIHGGLTRQYFKKPTGTSAGRRRSLRYMLLELEVRRVSPHSGGDVEFGVHYDDEVGRCIACRGGSNFHVAMRYIWGTVRAW
jgi:hypothetical protein